MFNCKLFNQDFFFNLKIVFYNMKLKGYVMLGFERNFRLFVFSLGGLEDIVVNIVISILKLVLIFYC